MKLSIENENYCATIVRVNHLNDFGLNTLLGFPIMGTQALVGKNTKIGDLGVLFTTESQLSVDYCSNNNLYRNVELNQDKEKTGFFEMNRRVKAIKLAKQVSNSYFADLSSLSYLGINTEDFQEGDKFTHINGTEICRKYTIRRTQGATNKTRGLTKKFTRVDCKLFPEHFDTAQYFRCISAYSDNTPITVTQKVHGCVEANTVINTDIGNKTIKEIVDNKLNCKILALNIKENRKEYVKIDQYYLKPNDGEWYEIELENGQTIKITGNNPVWLPELQCYRRVDELSENDLLLISNTNPWKKSIV